jgi:hypothetical protein
MTRPYFATIGGTDLKAKKFIVSNVTGLWERPLAALVETTVYQQEGAMLADAEPLVGAGDIVIAGTINGASADDSETLRTALLRFLGPGGRRDHTLIFAIRPSSRSPRGISAPRADRPVRRWCSAGRRSICIFGVSYPSRPSRRTRRLGRSPRCSWCLT